MKEQVKNCICGMLLVTYMYILKHAWTLSERLHKELVIVFLSRERISVAGGLTGVGGYHSYFLLLGRRTF